MARPEDIIGNGKPKWERRPSGTIIIDGQEVAHTLQCCHCNGHFVSVRGSGRKRGWCMNCNQITCGKGNCDRCIAFEKKLGLYEAGKISTLD